jgi:hypothetical protein
MASLASSQRLTICDVSDRRALRMIEKIQRAFGNPRITRVLRLRARLLELPQLKIGDAEGLLPTPGTRCRSSGRIGSRIGLC